MLRLPKKTLFSIEAVLDIAFHAGAEPVQSRDITRRQQIPRRYLEQTLQELVRAGVLVGVRGPKGGYRLARERRRISLGDIVRVVEPGAGSAFDDDAEKAAGSELALKVVRPLWTEFRDEMLAKLDTITIDCLCSEADKIGIQSEGRPNLDFII